MDAVKFIKEQARMLNRNENGFCNISCVECPLGPTNNGHNIKCTTFEIKHTEEAVRIVEDWSRNHPQKTYLMDFMEKFPNCEKDCNGIPEACRKHIYPQTTKKDCCGIKCSDCWNEPMPEKGNLNG